MFADVVVLTYQSPEIDFYTYKVPKDLESRVREGQLVEVPFGKRNPMGIIVATRNKKPFNFTQGEPETINVKLISQILLPQPILLPYQIKLLKWMSEFYVAPMVNCLEAMIPELPNAKNLKTNAKLSDSFSRSSSGVMQTLVLVPSLNRLPEVMAKFKSAKNYFLYHNELKNKEKFEVWLKMLSGNVQYLFGSRSAIFAPCPKLSQIIIFDEHDGVYKDERSPYFDTLTVAEKICTLTGAKLKIIDSSPKVTTYFSNRASLTLEKIVRKVEIVSMQNERIAGNRSPISEKLITYLKYANKKNKKVLLFLNKKSESGHIFCKICKRSEFVKSEPDVCPNCKSADFYFNSLNIFSLRDLVLKMLPSAYVNLIAEGEENKGLDISNQGLVDIGTAAILYKLLPYRYDLIAHVFVDSVIGIADFSADEKAYSQITDLKKLLGEKGLLMLQTYNEDNPTIGTAARGDYHKFYNWQVDLRKKLNYPPLSLLVKLTIKGKGEEKVEEEARELVAKLHELSATSDPSTSLRASRIPATILGPYKSIFWSKIPSYNIILKYKLKNYNLESREESIGKLGVVLKIVPKDWRIIVEPDSIN